MRPEWLAEMGAGEERPERLTRKKSVLDLLENWPDALDPLLPEVDRTDQFWRRAANHFRLRLLRHHGRAKDNRGALYLDVESVPRIAMALADRLLWRLVPRKLRPVGWPKGESEFAAMHGTTVFGLRLWMRLGKYLEVEGRIGPLWSEDEVTKELVDRLTDRAFEEIDKPEDAEPRFVELALKSRKVIGAPGTKINNTLTMTKNEVNILPDASAAEVFALVREVQEAARALGMHEEETDGSSRDVEVVELPPGSVEGTTEGRAQE